MAEIERVSHGLEFPLEFPKDHFTHDVPLEWLYFWGRIGAEFFHFAVFSLSIGSLHTRSTHWSLHNKESRYFEEISDDFDQLKYTVTYMPKGNKFSIISKHFSLRMFPNSKPMIHESTENRGYYSIPSMFGEGTIFPNSEFKSDVWMDHEITVRNKFSNWDWIGIKLDCGLYIMVHDSETDKRCNIQFNDKMTSTEFCLSGDHLFIDTLGMYLKLEPLVEEKIFDPKLGVSYSEQPFHVISNRKIIGYGMRERTYHNDNGEEQWPTSINSLLLVNKISCQA